MSGSVKAVLSLREKPLADLSLETAKTMLHERSFYDNSKNPEGKGVIHNYEENPEKRIIVDNATGLVWQQSGSQNKMPYSEADHYITNLNAQVFVGHQDWRLPTLEEAMSLMEREELHGLLRINPLFDYLQEMIWTSDKSGDTHAWIVCFNPGICGKLKVAEGIFVRAVRSITQTKK